MILDFNVSGTAVANEKVLCTEVLTISGTDYYIGHLNYLPNASSYGSGTYNVRTAPSGAGTLYLTVASYPANSGEIGLNIESGVLISTQTETVYINYLGHAPIKHNISDITLHYPGYLSGQKTIFESDKKRYDSFGYYEIYAEYPPSGTTYINFTNGVDAQAVSIASGVSKSAGYFTDVLKIESGQTFKVENLSGYGIGNVSIVLRGL